MWYAYSMITYCCKDCGTSIHFNTALHGTGICRTCSNKKRGIGIGNSQFICLICGKEIIAHTASKRKFCCRKCYDKWQAIHSHGFKVGHKLGMTGKKQPESQKLLMTKKLTGHKFWGGEKAKEHWIKKGEVRNPFPKGHIPWNAGTSTNPNHSKRMTKPYKEWRLKVFKKDDYTCQLCFKRGGNLVVHHKKSYALFPELRLDVSNGQTMHKDCHRKTDNFGIKAILKQKEN
jgi:hypothetical protein